MPLSARRTTTRGKFATKENSKRPAALAYYFVDDRALKIIRAHAVVTNMNGENGTYAPFHNLAVCLTYCTLKGFVTRHIVCVISMYIEWPHSLASDACFLMCLIACAVLAPVPVDFPRSQWLLRRILICPIRYESNARESEAAVTWPANRSRETRNGGPGRARTSNQTVMSRRL